MIYYYYPFDDDEKFLELLNEKIFIREKTGMEPITFMCEQAQKYIRLIKGGDRLYIVAHGNTSGIGHGLNYYDSLTPSQLANKLLQLKLTKEISDIRIFSCDSGIKHSMHIPSFAQRFKESMLSLGYKKVTVTGYLGQVYFSRDNRINRNFKLDKRQRKGIVPSPEVFQNNLSNEIFIASQFKVKF
ncbi:hypothetical protein ACIXPW_004127 [Escherichia coli]|uniref:hypothetical protein n=1 Tax=Escherichia coli TaxID=562 RepID=UPI000BB9586C|nr:hypothetical protein [Escherichia coli]EEZ5728251.1 hypothetical protein [Escherichia coli O25]ELR3168158.1 hypothetical protein [Escherichia coli]ELR3310238.1 hypothetical protein [Escherichia coli]ELR3315069.1 hypothetical protein [Escherichia coli]ELR3345927.1 hypothetical protein [Escherichia coli]